MYKFIFLIHLLCVFAFSANSYSDPNFNIETSTNVAGLTALKGSAPSATDKIYIYNSATVTLESNLAILLITLGQTSAGAATDGKRRGYLVVNAGVTVTFTGNATQANSGIACNPTSAPGTAGESRSCMVYMNGTPTSRITLTNSIAGSGVNNKWGIFMSYGALKMQCVDMNYTYAIPVYANANTTYSDSENVCNSLTSTPLTAGTGVAAFVYLYNANINKKATFTLLTIANPVSSGSINFITSGGTSCIIVAGGEIVTGGIMGTSGASTTYGHNPVFVYRSSAVNYINTMRFSASDVRPTSVIPADLALTDLKDGTIKITVSNIASYNDTDRIFLYDSLGNIISSFSKKMYTTDGATTAGIKRKPVNCAIIAGASLQSLTGIYAKASSDGYQYSFPSATASVTATYLPVATNVITGTKYGQSGTEFTGTASAGINQKIKKQSFKNY